MTMTTDHDQTRPAEILDLTGRRMEKHSPLLEEAWRYWNSLRSGGGVPRREALDPRKMSLTLGHSMILDRTRPGTVRVRLGGRVMNGLMGMEVRGLPIRAFFDLTQRGHAAALVEKVFELPATLELDLISHTMDGATHARMLVLPLRDRAGVVTKALTCIALDRLDFEPPHRFSILREQLGPLKPHPALHGNRARPARRAQDLPMEMAEAQDGFAPRPKPYLRVVK
ncbi:PAS domain-containing protein [Jannaschia seohaensis]|uniref:PAS domain-containing protein n=1 Tax=Jannaschia seohaensis TaxID=475081 RepID=A0A2Y9C5G0_9RHOB|nr:PAS domain-containing protein [Jannaschia seohaensis]PWJ20843.1 PAS domain-containing protein [Jannaschia seohaensis]SSA41253.1 PAS domain-containing protein [Jannaschia seohaensis]